MTGVLKTDSDSLEARVGGLLARNRELERELDKLRDRLASSSGKDLMDQAVEVAGVKLLAVRLDGADAKSLPNSLDQFKNRLGSGVVVLGAADGDKVALVAGVTDDLTDRVQAGPLVNHVAGQVGGKGGGRPDMARAGGKDAAKLDGALASVESWLKDQL